MSTERTILSPFTKEYRVLVTLSGIRQFLEGHSLLSAPIPILVLKGLGFLFPLFCKCFVTGRRRKDV
ncbi:hypothetical protein E1A91_A11G224500v1 [Gossypium mustelinum]|uniref:Uncharacterized protein n=1 Tax=Gossypium mustelinum TaxID=34275 RepID=A0A5D2XAF0_GOSMU|nr:hypothetical protein E1A91_A11G224500v1 [Gossypium mustelinum]